MINTRMNLLRCATLSAGLLALFLRALLYATGIDHSGLIASNHWATRSILILSGLVLLFLLVITRKPEGPTAYKDCFPASFSQGVTSFFIAVVIAFRAISQYTAAGDSLELLAALFGIVTGIAMAVAGICRVIGKRPSFLCHSALAIFFALQMVSQYRHWSADPQLIDYAFYLLAFVCLMLTAYFLAGFEADMGNRRALWFFSMAASFFCLLALPESGDAGLLIACALWAFFCVPQSQAKPRRSRPAMNLDEETENENS